jgi:hypothetical protein
MPQLRHLLQCTGVAALVVAALNCSSGSASAPKGGDAGSGSGSGTGHDGGTHHDGGTGSGSGSADAGCPKAPTPPTDAAPLLGAACDPLVPSHCGFPFPSNVYLVPDSTTKSGFKVAIPKEAMPVSAQVGALDPGVVADSDGFSPGQTILTQMPGATITGLPTQDTLAMSVTTTSPTILLNADTGELVPHFSELDDEIGEGPSTQTFMIRPVVRLGDATHYIVAIRHLPPSPTFKALRDGTASCDPSVALRKTLYADIFAKLNAAGIDPSDLQIAWDYTTATQANNTQWLLHMRDDALAYATANSISYTLFPPAPAGTTPDPSSPSCNNLTVSTVNATETHAMSPNEIGSGNCSQDGPTPHIWRRLFGLMTVPIYTTSPNPALDADMTMPAGLNFGPDGMPAQNGLAQYEFEVSIPTAATVTPGNPLANGHGLLGHKTEGDSSYLPLIDDQGDFVSIAVDFVGFSADDNNVVTNMLGTDVTQFKNIVGRQHQGFINSLLAMRVIKELATDPTTYFNGNPTIDPSKVYYRGDSQGGIMGTTYMAISTDVTQGVLGEPGSPYSLLLNRSADFGPFFVLMKIAFGTGANIQTTLGLLQMVWDRTEPDGYMPYIVSNMLPSTPAHNILIHDNIGDYQVTPLGAHVIARAVGAKNLSAVNREIYGIPDAPGPLTGPTIVEWSWGLEPAPETNIPPSNLCTPDASPLCGDPHDQLRIQPSSIAQEVQFFHTGAVVQTCGGGGDGGAAPAGPCVGTFL